MIFKKLIQMFKRFIRAIIKIRVDADVDVYINPPTEGTEEEDV